MNKDNEFDENTLRHIKMQQDLIKLMKVIDDCIEGLDNFYYYAKKKEMLSLSNNN